MTYEEAVLFVYIVNSRCLNIELSGVPQSTVSFGDGLRLFIYDWEGFNKKQDCLKIL